MQKVALVTGSATGVGRACAVRFAKLGYAVGVNYSKSVAEAEETADLVRACGVPVLVHRANIGDDTQVRGMLAAVESTFGGLDVLVNNAATTHFVPHADLDALTDAIWDEILQVNVKGTFYCCRAAMPLLKARKGNIVTVSSVAGLTGQGSSIPYCASKAAVNALTRWLAGRETQIEKYLESAPLKRAADPDDVADVVLFLANGTSLMTGQVVVVDGGRTM